VTSVVALTQSIVVNGVSYAAGTDHTVMPPLVVDQIRNPNAWVDGVVPTAPVSLPGKSRIGAGDLSSASRAREALGLGTAALMPKESLLDARSNRDVAYRGVNLSGAEFGTWDTANLNPTHWRWPLEQEWQYLASRGHKLVRLPYMWERLQPDLSKPLSATQLVNLDQQLGYAAKYGLKVVLDNHNYSMYKGKRFAEVGGPTQAQFVSHWQQMSARYRDHPAVIGYGLMNEPQSIPTADLGDGAGSLTGQLRWYRLAQAAIDGIRATGDRTAVCVSGYAVGVVASWLSSTPGLGNKEIHRYVVDPADNLLFEGHQYFDGSGTYANTYASFNASSGQSDSPNADGILKAQLIQLHAWLDWAEEHGLRVFLGEVGWPRVTTGQTAPDVTKWNALAEEYFRLIDAYGSRVWVTAWAAGSKWSDTYALNFYVDDATDPNKIATPAENAEVLEKHLTFESVYVPRKARGVSAVRKGLQWRGQNVPLEMCSGTGAMVSGQEFGTMVAIDNPGHIARIVVYVNTAGAGNVAGQCLVGVYDPDSGLPLAVSGDIGGSLLNLGYRTLELSTRTDRTFQTGDLVGVKLLWNGTTPPVLLKAPAPASAVSTRHFGVVSTGATALSATLPFATMTAPTQPFWVAVSGY
jgi:endoglucanase